MGTKISSIIPTQTISIEDIKGKKLVIDAYNMLYQFITTIRQRDGSFLTDSKGKITSHLSGLFFRTAKLMNHKIKVAFVFDGLPPALKEKERERRKQVKQDAQRKYEDAVDKGDIELMRKYAGRTARLTTEMIDEAKELISALGLPIINAPSEGEAQAAYMVKKGEFFALLSQDTDGLLFGSPKIVKNLSVSGRRKKTGTGTYTHTEPELIDLDKTLETNEISQDQLIVIAMLCGTDFNIGGIKGIGPKKGLALVKKHNQNFEKLFEEVEWTNTFDFSWKEVFDIFKKIPIKEDYELEWTKISEEKIIDILVEKHEFSKERIEKFIQEIIKQNQQKGLSDFF